MELKFWKRQEDTNEGKAPMPVTAADREVAELIETFGLKETSQFLGFAPEFDRPGPSTLAPTMERGLGHVVMRARWRKGLWP